MSHAAGRVPHIAGFIPAYCAGTASEVDRPSALPSLDSGFRQRRIPLQAMIDFDEPEPSEEFDDDDIEDDDDERNMLTDTFEFK